MSEINGDALRGHLDTMILSVLRRGEGHGFDILRRLESAGCGALRLKEGSLYPALYRLEAAGMIRGAWEESQSKRRGPRRRVYRLTSKGGAKLKQARGEFEQFVAIIGGIIGVPA
jgi:DNA-binding PadR family transcriptional regulator